MNKNPENSNKKAVSVTLFIVSLFVLACVVGLLGDFGNGIKNFILGVFGLASIPVFIAVAVISIMYVFGKKPTCSVWAGIRYFGTILFIILTFHAITSHGLIGENTTFGEYILACYNVNNTATAGGLVFAVFAYPLMSVSYALALTCFILLTLGFAALSILPEIRREKGTSKPKKISARSKKPAPIDFNSYPQQGVEQHDVGSGLFVSTVDGEKDGDKIRRQRGNLNVNYEFLHPNKVNDDDEVECVRVNDVDRAHLAEDKKRQAFDSLFNFQNSYDSKDYRTEEDEPTVVEEIKVDAPSKAELSDKLNSFLLYQDTDVRSYTNNYRRDELNNAMNGGGSSSSMASYVSKYDELFGAKKEESFQQSQPVEPTFEAVDDNYDADTFVNDQPAFDNAYSQTIDTEPAEPKPLGIFDLNLGGQSESAAADDFADYSCTEPLLDEPTYSAEEDEAYPDNEFDAQDVEEEQETVQEEVVVQQPAPVQPEPEVQRVSRFKAPEGFVRHVETTEQKQEPEPEPKEKPEPKRVMKPYVAPPVSLLNDFVPINMAENEAVIQSNADKIVEALNDFSIPSKVVGVTVGSAFSRYELQIDRKISVSSVLKYQPDIAMKLCAESIRIEAPIPGKDAIGIELPNKNRATVGVKRVMDRGNFFQHKSPIAFCLGEDIAGQGVICDIAQMPHLLIAGTTGSGKSVCINSLIISIICKSSPEDVRLMLIDPKRVELSIFNGLPHMLVKESISDADKVLNALNWVINEMDTRFNLFKAIGARNITEYNEAVLADKSAPKLPYIVVVVDEFGELMVAAKRDVESRILRLAQLARAAGIHLILATQRPSVDVITGTIKANLTSRIAFSVSSATDSKTILDYGGAEKLLGKGDMLYMVNGKTARLQGPFINGKEVREIVNFVKEHNDAYFDPAIEKVVNAVKEEFDSATVAEAPSRESELDEMFIPALKFIIREGKASISSLSTRFAIGYNRAARIIYNMEKQGYIGKAEGGAKARKVVITPFEFEEIFNESVDGDDEF